MATAADDFDELFDSLGLAGTAADNLANILQRVTVAEREAAMVAKLAAESGKTAAQVRSALAAAASEAAAAEKRLAADREAARKAAEETAAAEKALADARVAAAAAADEALMASSLDAMKRRDEAAAAQEERQKAADKEIADLQKKNLEKHQGTADAYWGRQKEIAEKAEEAVKPQAKLGDALTQVASSSTNAGGKLGQVQSILGMLGPKGQAVAIVLGAVVIAITAVAAGLAKLAQMAIAATTAKDRIKEALGALQGSGAAGGGMLLAQLTALSKVLPFTAGQLEQWARPLLALRMNANDVQGAIKGIAAATALMGEEGGRAAQGLYEDFQKLANQRMRVWLSPDVLQKMATAGVSAQALAKELGVTEQRLKFLAVDAKGLGDAMQRILLRQGAGALAAMGRDLDIVRDKVREGLGSAFADLGDVVTPFTKEVQLLASEFYRDSVGAKLLANVVRGLLEPAFKVATSAMRALHVGFLQLTIYGLQAYIALRPLGAWLDKIGVTSSVTAVLLEGLKWAAIGLAVALGLLAVGLFLVALPFVLAAAAVLLVASGIAELGGMIVGAIQNFDNLKAAVLGAFDGLGEKALAAGGAIIDGLVQGISGGNDLVAAAMKALAMSALGAFTGVFQIKSPSRVMKKHAKEDIAGATATGLDDGSDEVDRAMRDMTSPPKGKGGRGRGGRGLGERVFNFINCTFGGGMTEQMVRDLFDKVLEEQAAAGPEPEPAF